MTQCWECQKPCDPGDVILIYEIEDGWISLLFHPNYLRVYKQKYLEKYGEPL